MIYVVTGDDDESMMKLVEFKISGLEINWNKSNMIR